MSTIAFTVNVNEDITEDDADVPALLSDVMGQRAVVDVEGYRFFGVVASDRQEALADLARAYEEQRRPGSNHLMTQALAEAIERVLA